MGKKTAPNGADRHTDRQTDGHGDSMTNLAQCQWGRVGENLTAHYDSQFCVGLNFSFALKSPRRLTIVSEPHPYLGSGTNY